MGLSGSSRWMTLRGARTTPLYSPISTPNSMACCSAFQRASSGKVENIACLSWLTPTPAKSGQSFRTCRSAIKRALKNLSPDDCAAREHDKRNHHLALYANPASVPIHLQPSAAVCLRSNADFDVAAGVAVIAVTHGPSHPIRRPFIIVSLPNAAREGAPFLHRRAARIKPVNFIKFRRERRPNLGAVRRKIRQHRHDALGRNGGAEVERDLGHLALIDTPVKAAAAN